MFSSSTTKAIIYVFGGIVAGALIWRGVPTLLNRNEIAGSVEHMNREAAQLNRSLPAVLDKETELMIAEGAHGMLIYKYRLINVSAAQLDYRRFAAEAKPKLVQAACSNPATRSDFLTKGISLRYSYFDKDKQHLATIDVAPKDCGL
jgi:hypothetical protein